ncbi:MAG: hypothetical protein HDR09_09330 [Lachnospiraceae bacterium]|nr:hypothetical protein [Lachnospiraceae bacterium]
MNVNGNNYNVTNNSLYNHYLAFSKSSGDKDIASDKSSESTDGVIYDKGSETSSKIYTSSGKLQRTKTDTSKTKYSGQEILDEIEKYTRAGQFYAIHYNGKETWLQGMTGGKNSEPVGGKKYFDPDELNAALGKGHEKTLSIGNNAISFDRYSYYKFNGKGGKEHAVLSLGGALSVGILGNSSYDKEAVDYVNFWNSLARKNPSGIYMKFSNEEIRGRLAGAGIENGFFTVSIGGSTVTHYLSQGETSSAVHSKEQYDNRYNMITSGKFFKQFEAGQKVMIGGKEYVLGEDKKLDIEYGADIFDMRA